MTEEIVRQVSVVGHVIEDLTLAALERGRYDAELEGSGRHPIYKDDGFFVFTDVPAGTHTLRLSGAGFQSRELAVTAPVASLVVAAPGDNEFLVVVTAVNQGNRLISFDTVDVRRRVPAGARVLASGLSTTLDGELGPGPVASARLASVAGLAAGALVRIVRQDSIRLRFGPYSARPAGRTRLVGTVRDSAPAGIGLSGAEVRLIRVNGELVQVTSVAGAAIASVTLTGKRRILGVEQDVVTLANRQGDFNLYTSAGFFSTVELRAQKAGYQSASIGASVAAGERTRIDFDLVRL